MTTTKGRGHSTGKAGHGGHHRVGMLSSPAQLEDHMANANTHKRIDIPDNNEQRAGVDYV